MASAFFAAVSAVSVEFTSAAASTAVSVSASSAFVAVAFSVSSFDGLTGRLAPALFDAVDVGRFTGLPLG